MTAEPHVVELRIADQEPVASFIRDVGEALGVLSVLGDDELAGCPGAVAIGIAKLRGAVAALTGEESRPAEPRGDVIIEWPPPGRPFGVPGVLMTAFEVSPAGGKPHPLYATRITIHAMPDGIVAAEVEAVVDDDGQPIPEGFAPIIVNGQLPVRTFWYEVAEMRTRQP